MARRTVDLSKRHDAMLYKLKDKLDTSLVDVVQRALEALEEKEAARDKEVNPK
jgi:hypothetical protein